MKITNPVFRQQIKDDIKLIQEKVSWDANIQQEPYAFNLWILSKIYNLDEELCVGNITEYNDKGMDCFVHYEEDKELYIIQNKYYDENTPLDRKDMQDFLHTPLDYLEKGNYKKSPELQEIYKKIKNDSEYKVFLHFYVTNDNKTSEIEQIIKNYNKDNSRSGGLFRLAEIFCLSDINDKYYREPKDNVHLKFKLSLKGDKSLLTTSPNLADMDEAYYMMAKVQDIYQLWHEAKEKNYSLFEKNIREYLGGRGKINKNIIETLEDLEERHKFFYYNNGITIICREASDDSSGIELIDPQVVNGCQTVSSIAEVFKNGGNGEFENIYVMTKIFVIKKGGEEFSEHVVKYTNSQNSINEKVFGATKDMFLRLQNEFKERGFLLCVKQSDRQKFKEEYEEDKPRGQLLNLANKRSGKLYKFDTIPKAQIGVEYLILIIAAFSYDKGGYIAYTKKSDLLKPSSTEYYQKISMKINEMFTTQQMVNLIILYKMAENDRRESKDKRTPNSYYLFNFLGFYLRHNGISSRDFLDNVSIDELYFVYQQFKSLSGKYFKKFGLEFNIMLKTAVDINIMQIVLDEHFGGLEEHHPEKYKEFEKIFSRFKKSE